MAAKEPISDERLMIETLCRQLDALIDASSATPGVKEELVAELGSAFLCADLELTPEVRDDHASYLASWLEVLRGDNRAIFGAAAHAQRAVDYLHKLQPERIEAAA